jgi:hypothetical protein
MPADELEAQSPRLITVDSVTVDKRGDDLIARLRDERGRLFAIRIHQSALDALILGLVTQAPKIKGEVVQPLTLNHARAFSQSDGKPGLEMTFDSGMTIRAILPGRAVEGLKTVLQQHAAPKKPRRPPTH